MDKGKNTVSVVIPTKNESKTIRKIINNVRPFCDEVLVVDGHSIDDTAKIAEEEGANIILDNKKGKGAALRLAAQKVKGNIIVFFDADGSHEAKDIPKLVQMIEKGKDLVIASRSKGGSDELHGDFVKFIRLIGSNLITIAINYRWNVRLTDSQNGFRAIKTDVMNNLRLTENIFTIEQEMLMKTLKKDYNVGETASHEYEREYGNSRINLLKMGPRYVWCLLKNIL
jgi:dolichol-phosphate mannosyltransferase|tara:strand:+ start:202 stop:882 length:681 start_codon:yes stop_codon:yes gene_type:complete